MINIWLFRRLLKIMFPVGRRIKVTGPFLDDALNDILYHKYIGEFGTIIQHHFHNATIGWIGILLDSRINEQGNNIVWFDPSEIEVHYESDIC